MYPTNSEPALTKPSTDNPSPSFSSKSSSWEGREIILVCRSGSREEEEVSENGSDSDRLYFGNSSRTSTDSNDSDSGRFCFKNFGRTSTDSDEVPSVIPIVINTPSFSCWYRSINPEYEIRTLGVRARLSKEELANQEPMVPKKYDCDINPFPDNFTVLSCFHYLAKKTQQKILYNEITRSKRIDILLFTKNPSRSLWWRNSARTEVTDSIFKKHLEKQEFADALKEHSIVSNFLEDRVERCVQSSFGRAVNNLDFENPDSHCPILPWTEGLFRYHLEEISGIIVDLNISDQKIKAIAFHNFLKTTVNVTVPYYYLHENIGRESNLLKRKNNQIKEDDLLENEIDQLTGYTKI